jgi:hypothetical protein
MLMSLNNRAVQQKRLQISIRAEAFDTCSHTPFLPHREKRVYTLCQLPSDARRSRQRLPSACNP